MATEVAPVAALNLPATHTVQVVALAPAYEPAGQTLHADIVAKRPYLPATQVVQLDDPVDATWPLTHDVHLVNPVAAVYLPTTHVVQALRAEKAPNEPNGQSRQLIKSLVYFPAEHRVQKVNPVWPAM